MAKVRAEIKFKNSLLYNLILSNFPRENQQYGVMNVRLAAEEIGINYGILIRYLCLKQNPYAKIRGIKEDMYGPELKRSASKVCSFFSTTAGILFPPELYGVKFSETLIIEREVSFLDAAEAEELMYLPKFVADIELQDAFVKALETLTPREEQIIKQRFGISGEGELTLREVGKIFGVTADRIRSIEAKALRKLRHPSRVEIIRGVKEKKRR